VKVTVTINGGQVAAEVADRTLLVHFLREQAGLTAEAAEVYFEVGLTDF